MMEIEHKFLVHDLGWGDALSSHQIEQGYVFIGGDRSLRMRRMDDDYFLTLKVKADGMGSHEIECPASAEQGQLTLENLCISEMIQKVRHRFEFGGNIWEVDVFSGANEGLIIAEIELSKEGQAFAKPPWIGREVTEDERFFNAYLSKHPFKDWGVSYQELLEQK